MKTRCPHCLAVFSVLDKYLGKTAKCVKCQKPFAISEYGETNQISDLISQDTNSTMKREEGMIMNVETARQPLAMIAGKPANATLGAVVPAMFGKTTLSLYGTRIVEATKRIVSRRDSELLLAEVDSAELTVRGNPLWIILGVFTLGFFGIGVIFFIVYFFSKHRFLIIHSKSNAQIVGIKGDEGPYRDFMAAVLKSAEEHKNR